MNIDNIYEALSLIRMEVRNFKPNRNGKSWNWACEVCGDSTNGRKARFGVTVKSGSAVCNCFNCGYANNFFSYLRSYHPSIYERFAVSDLVDRATSEFSQDFVFNQDIADSDLLVLFYGDTFDDPNEWVDFMKQKKIVINKNNFTKLFKIFREKK